MVVVAVAAAAICAEYEEGDREAGGGVLVFEGAADKGSAGNSSWNAFVGGLDPAATCSTAVGDVRPSDLYSVMPEDPDGSDGKLSSRSFFDVP